MDEGPQGQPAPEEPSPVSEELAQRAAARGIPLERDGQPLTGFDHNDEPTYGDHEVGVGDVGSGDEAPA